MHNIAAKGQPWARIVQIPSPPARGGPAPGRRDGDATPLFVAGRVCGDGRRQGRLREPYSPMIPRCLCTAPRPLRIVLQPPASLHFSPGIVARARRCPWVSRIKTSVRWTLVPANGKSTEGFPRPAKRRRTAKRRRQGAREKMRGGVAYTTLSTQPSAMRADTRPQ